MTKALALFAFVFAQLGVAQVLPPTKFPGLPTGFKQTVISAFAQTCTGEPPVFNSCTTTFGNPATGCAVNPGNEFDRQGNLYFSFQNAIMRMTPSGEISTFAAAPVVTTCTQPTTSTAVFTTTSIGAFTFSLAANALYVTTGNSMTTFSSAMGSCNPDGTFTGTLSNGTFESTTAVLVVTGF